MDRDSHCHVELILKPFDEKDCSEISEAGLLISGMGCPNCAIRVRNALIQLDGVNWVNIDLESGRAQVAYDATKISPEQFMPAVAAADPQGRHRYQAGLIG